MTAATAMKAFSRRVVEIVKSGTAEAEKRNGLVVKRPVLNAEEWADWAVRHNIPSPVPAAALHVTVVYSKTDVKMKPSKNPLVIPMGQAAFMMFGPAEDALVVAFESWTLWDRHFDFRMNGAESDWPSYRPHMTISYSAAAFEIPDEALDDAPAYIVLGGEVYDEPVGDFAATLDVAKNAEGLAGDDASRVTVVDAVRAAAGEALKAHLDLNVVDRTALYEIAKTGHVAAGALARLSVGDSAVSEVAKAVEASPDDRSHADGQDFLLTAKTISEDVAKSLGMKEAIKGNAAEQMVVMIASVSTVNGEVIKDLHGDEMDTQALIEFSRDIMRGTRAGQFNHNGDNRNEIVQSLVLSEDIQKALGINLGYEPYLIEMHVPNPEDWAKVMEGEWGASIRGTMYVEGPEA